MSRMLSVYRCPKGCDLRGDPLPAHALDRAKGRTHTSRRVGLWDMNAGRVRAWWCPDCDTVWPR